MLFVPLIAESNLSSTLVPITDLGEPEVVRGDDVKLPVTVMLPNTCYKRWDRAKRIIGNRIVLAQVAEVEPGPCLQMIERKDSAFYLRDLPQEYYRIYDAYTGKQMGVLDNTDRIPELHEFETHEERRW